MTLISLCSSYLRLAEKYLALGLDDAERSSSKAKQNAVGNFG